MTREEFGCGLRDETAENRVEVVHVVADRERASSERAHRELRRVQDRITVRSRTQPCSSFGEVGFGNVAELFPQEIWAGETEVADLIEAAGAGLAAGTLRDQQRSDRFDVAVGGFAIPRARPDSAARAASIASTGSDLPCMRRS